MEVTLHSHPHSPGSEVGGVKSGSSFRIYFSFHVSLLSEAWGKVRLISLSVVETCDPPLGRSWPHRNLVWFWLSQRIPGFEESVNVQLTPTKPLEVFNGTKTYTKGRGAEFGIRGWEERRVACQARSFSLKFQVSSLSLSVLKSLSEQVPSPSWHFPEASHWSALYHALDGLSGLLVPISKAQGVFK